MTMMNETLLDNVEVILDHFKIEYKNLGNRIAFKCPIHDSGNEQSLSIKTNGHGCGKWRCWTQHCESEYGDNIYGLIKGIMSVDKGKEVANSDVSKYISKLLNLDTNSLRESVEYKERKSFIKNVYNFVENEPEVVLKVSRSTVLKELDIPAAYYIERGYCPEILIKYDIGLCDKPEKHMFNRIVVPVYDETGNRMVGCSARNTDPQCEVCGYCHRPTKLCPTDRLDKYKSNKWINNKGFYRENYLYNYWFAKEHINKTGNCILVEGPGDTWKVEQANIHNSLAIFGSILTDSQCKILEKMNIQNLIIATDNDEPGLQARKHIRDKCSRLYNIIDVYTTKKDMGETNVETIQEILGQYTETVNGR